MAKLRAKGPRKNKYAAWDADASRLLLLLLLLSAPAAAAEPEEVPPRTLVSCVERALQHSPIVGVAREKAAMAGARYDEVRWRWIPDIELTTLFSYAPGQAGDVGGEAGGVFDNWGPLVRIEVRGEMPLYTFSRMAADDDVARARYDAARARVADSLRDVAHRVRRAWHEQVAARAKIEILERGMEILRGVRRRLDELEEEDDEDLDPVEALKVRVRMSDYEIRLRAERRREREALSTLRMLMDLPPDESFAVEHTTPAPELIGLAPLDEVVGVALTFSDELRSLRDEVRAAHYEVRSRERAMYPEFYAAGLVRFGYAAASEAQLSPFADDPANSWEVALLIGIRVPLDLPQGLARRESAEAASARWQREQQVRSLELELRVTRLYGQISDSLRLLPTIRDAARAARSWFFARTSTFDLGMSGLGDYLGALGHFVERQLALIEAVRTLNVSVSELSRRAGVETSFLEKDSGATEPADLLPALHPRRGFELPDDLSPELRERILRRLGADR